MDRVFGPNGIFAERYRGLWLLCLGSSWMLLFVYGTIKFLWMREWGYACATGGVIALGPLGVALTVWNRNRRMRAEDGRQALEAQLDDASRDLLPDAPTLCVPVAATQPRPAPVD